MAEKKEYVKLWLSYESYFEAFSDVEVGRLVRAMIKYRVSREEPKFNGNERFIWPAIRRDIDESLQAQESTSAARSEAGKQGGRAKAKKANAFEESKKSYGQGQGQGQGHGQGQGQDISAPAREGASAVLADYLNRVNPMASQSCLDELKGFAEVMGPDVCKRAFDIALDSKKTTWPYIRAILQDKQARGVKCLADWEKLEAGKQNAKGLKTGESKDADVRADLARMDKYLAGIRKGEG